MQANKNTYVYSYIAMYGTNLKNLHNFSDGYILHTLEHNVARSSKKIMYF